MKEYIPTGTSGKYIEYDPATNISRVITKSEIETQITNWEAELESLPEITDEFLLAWAKENYPTGTQKELLNSLINEANAIIEKLD